MEQKLGRIELESSTKKLQPDRRQDQIGAAGARKMQKLGKMELEPGTEKLEPARRQDQEGAGARKRH